ncbi:MAG: bifunctional [glutamate--ammonia ligase]-adenylyl-L-tyrosine phosphorylase/[glutamate--ammonia-ligase] adenylyltransferase [Gallionellaceae bacterium]
MNIAIDFDTALRRALDGSRYAQQLLDSDAGLLPWLNANYSDACSAAEMAAWLDAMPATDEPALARALRLLRKRVMLKLLTRDLGGLATLDEVMAAMTALAELAVRRAQACIMQSLTGQFGIPTGAAGGAAQELLVIGMGKLGGGELNVSSDIDLIFVFPEDGATNGARPISNHEFFSKLGRRLIGMISEPTGDGYVFRVDMRLRPYGDSGPLTMSFAALEEYLAEQGREWERYAWIKAHVISPVESPFGGELMQLVQPFVFRKYLDFGAFDSMRKLHAQIRREVHRRDRLNNIKLGPGGIREIEFIAQVFQLIRGGRDARLRIRPTLQVLQRLGENGQLAPEIVNGLSEAYIFLRNLEHRLQYLEDQQTQDIPQNASDRELLAAAMGYADYPALQQQLDSHRARVSTQFERIFSTQQGKATDSSLWHDNLPPQELREGLSRLGYGDASGLAERLIGIRDSVRYRQLPESSRQRFDQLVPQFITFCSAPEYHAQTLPRVLKFLESISRRASYLSFLTEYPQVLQRLVQIASASEWACDYLIQHPILLDELLDAGEIYQAPDWAALDATLQQQLRDHQHDIERQLDVLLQFRHSQTFRLLAMDLQGLLPLEILSDHLSDLADLILRHVLQLCWQEARKKHQERPFFAIIAYGKLGGRELGYASDLDLIFLYDDPHPDAAEIYARLTKSINTMLGSYTPGGRLYETDLRLRPNGASGLLVSSIAAFAEYQWHNAWVWEHQALTRTRYCAGDAQVGEKFEAIRSEVLRQKRDLPTLRKEVAAMRQKMHDGHPNPGALFDIKHDQGGMVDIEFIVQFLVLAHAAAHPELTANSGNLALLMLAGKLGLIDAQLAEEICGIYRTLRTLQHKMRLNSSAPCRVDAGEIDTRPVTTLWQQLFGDR